MCHVSQLIARELKHETRVLSKLNHPGVLTLIGYTEAPAQIVLEMLDGTLYVLTPSPPVVNPPPHPTALGDTWHALLTLGHTWRCPPHPSPW